jgi:N-acetyl-alpha-D-muramate 1-phosphate uridylyltransferase
MIAPDRVCAVVLAAGLGVRLRPLTELVPKALVPVGNEPLLESALRRLADVGLTGPDRVAVNAHWLGEQVVAQVGDRARLSVEPQPLGTAGSLGHLREWIDGRAVLALNADAYVSAPPGDLSVLLDGWDGASVRMMGVPSTRLGEFGGFDFAGASLLPWADAGKLQPSPAELVKLVWRPAEREGRLAILPLPGTYLDCGTPDTYHAANMHAAARHGDPSGNIVAPDALVSGRAERCVIGAGAQVLGQAVRCVLWPGAHVAPGEVLVDAIRVGSDLTVPAL